MNVIDFARIPDLERVRFFVRLVGALIRRVAGRMTALTADRHLLVGTVTVLADGTAISRPFEAAGDRTLTFFVFAGLGVAIHALRSFLTDTLRRVNHLEALQNRGDFSDIAGSDGFGDRIVDRLRGVDPIRKG